MSEAASIFATGSLLDCAGQKIWWAGFWLLACGPCMLVLSPRARAPPKALLVVGWEPGAVQLGSPFLLSKPGSGRRPGAPVARGFCSLPHIHRIKWTSIRGRADPHPALSVCQNAQTVLQTERSAPKG